MCGIFGLVGNPSSLEQDQDKVFRLLTRLWINTQIRGTHASGYMTLTRGRSLSTFKAPVTASDFIVSDEWTRFEGHSFPPFFIGHCRAATHGDPKINENNHPFLSNNGRYAFMHNGLIRQHESLAKQEGVTLLTKCDSEVILRVIETEMKPELGIKKVFNRVFSFASRDGACVLTDSEGPAVYLFRNAMRPLHVVRLPELGNAVIFASTQSIMFNAIKEALGEEAMPKGFDIKSERIYKVHFVDGEETPKIETKDVPVKSYRTKDFFSRGLQAPRRHRTQYTVTACPEQTTLFESNAPTCPEEVHCPCGNVEFVWPQERRKCQACGDFELSPNQPPICIGESASSIFLRFRCNGCGQTWEQPQKQNMQCPSCKGGWVDVVGKGKTVECNVASVWCCDKCKMRFIGMRAPDSCSQCGKHEEMTWEGPVEGMMLPDDWKLKRCHDCSKKIPANGPTRCLDCVEKRKKRRG